MDYLFSLVQSMSATEKRYFTRLSTLQTQNTVNQYAQLFNKLCKVKKYNEKEIKKEFNSLHFAQLKQTLYKKILQALRMFHASEHFENEPNIHLTNYKILLSKGLLEEAKKEFNRAERTALSGSLTFETALLFREKNFQNTRTSSADEISDRIKNHDDFWSSHIKQLENELKYEKLFLEVESLNKQFEGTRNSFEKRNVSDFLQNFLLINEKSAETEFSKILFNFIKGLAYYLTNDYSYSEKYFVSCAQLFESSPGYIHQKEDLYIRSLANLCLIQLYLKNEQFDESLDRLNNYKSNFPHITNYKNYIWFTLKLMTYNTKKEFIEGGSHLDKHEELILKIENSSIAFEELHQEINFCTFQKLFTLLGLQKQKKAIETIQYFIKHQEGKIKEEVIVLAKIILFFAEVENNSEEVTKDKLEDFQQFIIQKSKVYLFEKQILKFISNILEAKSINEKKLVFTQLKNDMSNLKNFDLEKNALLFFDFSEWLNFYNESNFIGKDENY